MIQGVQIKKLKVIPDERGWLMEMLRSDDQVFQKFGQVYMSAVYPGVVKAWHCHEKQTDYFTVVKGMAKIVLYDSRKDSPTYGQVKEFFMGEKNPILITIPPMVLHGMKGIGLEPAFIINCPTEPYNYKEPDEIRVEPHDNDIPYDWSRKDG
ncbi:dTDP-4-dehydrorhamnose 3,5-epimerase [Candidatus Poribacteria bacterium]|nr:dTDP-4-dehydrorhamnose 3,5-epimerase [Candidatus Poribacteria bacterium]